MGTRPPLGNTWGHYLTYGPVVIEHGVDKPHVMLQN